MNRYDLYNASTTVVDPKDQQPWPDPLSKKFGNFNYTSPPIQYAIDDTFILSPYLVAYAMYKVKETNPDKINFGSAVSYDDIILMINNIPHISLVNYDEIVKFPDQSDIIYFARRKATIVS
jgi:hypothetical protein